jgi:hypothetical protein
VSIVILLGLVAMWAVVLVPMWLRRHDEVEETRSLDRFNTAMHTLSRREAAADKKYVVMPHRSRALEVHVSGASADGGRKRRGFKARRPKSARRVVTAADRRRRTLLGLLLVTVVTVVAAVVVGGTELWALQFVVDACLLAFVVHLGLRARRVNAAHQARRRPVGAARPATPSQPARASKPVRRTRPVPQAEPEYEEVERYQPLPMAAVAGASQPEPMFDQTSPVAFEDVALDDTRVAAYHFDDTAYQPAAAVDVEPATAYEQVAEADPDVGIGERPWEPVPVPPPVYTTKPTAPRRRSRAPIMEPLLPPVDSPAELEEGDDLEEILDRRWAVND